jgi:hypothetical protein
MKHHITDALQIVAAILLTGGIAASAAPLPKPEPSISNNKPAVVQQVKTPEKPVEAPQTPAAPEKVVTWQDNPNHCTDAQYIAQDAPYACIDKPAVVAKAPSQPAAVSFGGNKQSWLEQSGIPSDQWWAVDWIVSRESGWDPCAYNPGQSDCSANPTTACGLVQQYPCHKIPGDWRDPVAALRWQYNYVNKYGGYAGAVEYWKIHGNY